MLRLESVLDSVISLLKKNDYFSDIKVIKAYPCCAAPTRLTAETVAIGFDEISFSSAGVDESVREGDVTIFIDVFIPLKTNNARAVDIFTEICRCFNNFNILSVRCERLTVDISTAAYLLKTAFTFNNEIGGI